MNAYSPLATDLRDSLFGRIRAPIDQARSEIRDWRNDLRESLFGSVLGEDAASVIRSNDEAALEPKDPSLLGKAITADQARARRLDALGLKDSLLGRINTNALGVRQGARDWRDGIRSKIALSIL